MLKKIDVTDLRLGMFISDLDVGWMEHPFVRNRFLLRRGSDLHRMRHTGIRSVTIDTSKGLDWSGSPTVEEADAATESEVIAVASKPVARPRTHLTEELDSAVRIRHQAAILVKTFMQDARLGKAVELNRITPVVENMAASIMRNPGALLGLGIIKHKDDYTFQHSVSVCTLLLAFCRSREMDSTTSFAAGMGGLLHDVGKALVPDDILNKEGRLTDDEFEVMRRHPRDGYDILCRTTDIGPIPLDITLHHHERPDGNGYPDRQSNGQISELAQMAAIADVYDAITADRCYRKAIPPAEALRKMYEWSKFQFSPSLTQEFIRCIGIYPVGSLVILESGRMGVVVEQSDASLLTPTVNVFFNTKSQTYIKPESVNLARKLGFGGGDRIVRHEDPKKWNIDPTRYLSLAPN